MRHSAWILPETINFRMWNLKELEELEGVKDITIKTEMLNVLSFNSERL
jgi:hypothetical protein